MRSDYVERQRVDGPLEAAGWRREVRALVRVAAAVAHGVLLRPADERLLFDGHDVDGYQDVACLRGRASGRVRESRDQELLFALVLAFCAEHLSEALLLC